ncbi:MAG: hypothetical protein H7840_11685, partial [Alphaproteobacteria bacterium]
MHRLDGGRRQVAARARAVEAARLALLGPAPAAVIARAASMATAFLFKIRNDAQAGLAVARPAVAAIQAQGVEPDLNLLGYGIDCAERLGETADQDRFLALGLARDGGDRKERAQLLYTYATRLIQTGDLTAAERALREAETHFSDLGDVRSRAVTLGKIADILAARGQVDEALRIRREKELPVYERLGDVHARAVTLGRIADILTARGEVDEALRIRREKELPVYERLGDVRERAVTLGRIA